MDLSITPMQHVLAWLVVVAIILALGGGILWATHHSPSAVLVKSIAAARAPGSPPPVITPITIPTVSKDETPLQWALRTNAVPDVAGLVAFNNLVHQFPATVTYEDVLAVYLSGKK